MCIRKCCFYTQKFFCLLIHMVVDRVDIIRDDLPFRLMEFNNTFISHLLQGAFAFDAMFFHGFRAGILLDFPRMAYRVNTVFGSSSEDSSKMLVVLL